jgi:uncharacterized protein (DUF2252 family)
MAKSKIVAAWLSPAERRDLGRGQRKHLPRVQHAHWDAGLRTHSPSALMTQSMRGRVPELIKLKYQRMAASPFGYFRGAVPVMAADLALLPHTGILTQLCGDAHVSNLGSYFGAEGQLVFDINDFDETISGPFEWDIKRLATSIILAGPNNGPHLAANEDAVRSCIERYTCLIAELAQMSALDAARYRVHRLGAVKPVAAILRAAQRATPQHTLAQLTAKSPHAHGDALEHRRFKTQPPELRRVTGSEAASVLASLADYQQTLLTEQQHLFARYRPLDVAFKVVGTGSVGLRDYVVLLEGNGDADPLFLQIKQEVASAYAPWLPHRAGHNGRRVAEGQRAMQLQSDSFLGWTRIGGLDYLVRQLNDHKAAINVAGLEGEALTAYAHVCGELLARGHARSGDACRIQGYIGKGARFVDAVLRFAQFYAAQTKSDWHELVRQREK